MTEELSLGDRLRAIDESVFRRVAGVHAPVLDSVIPPLSEAASYSLLWIGVAVVLSASGGRRGRRTAVAAMATVEYTSAVANIAMKQAARRRRPHYPVPGSRRLEHPGSTSFPSGHAASAAAFSGVVGRASPSCGCPSTRWPGRSRSPVCTQACTTPATCSRVGCWASRSLPCRWSRAGRVATTYGS